MTDKTYNHGVCKGAIALGSGCMRCERCADQLAARVKELEAEIAAVGAGGVQALSAGSADPSITLDFKQATELLVMFGGEPGLITLQQGGGKCHSGPGLYAWYSDMPEEGAEFLGAAPDDSASPTPPAEQPAPNTGNAEADRIIGRLMSSDPDFEDCLRAAAFIQREIKGPDGFGTWREAAIAERLARVHQQTTTTEAATPKGDATTGAALGVEPGAVYATFEVWAKAEGGEFALYNCGPYNREAMTLAGMAWRASHALRVQVAPKAAPGARLTPAQARAMVAEMDMNDAVLAGIYAEAPQQEAQEPVAIKAMGYGGSTGVNDYLMGDGTIKAMCPREVVWAAPQPAPAPLLLAAEHKGMRVDYTGLLGQCRRALQSKEPANAEMLRQLQGHLQELGRCWYAGETVAVDEFLQLYCIEHEARAALSANGGN